MMIHWRCRNWMTEMLKTTEEGDAASTSTPCIWTEMTLMMTPKALDHWNWMILWMVLPPQSEREQRTKAGAGNEFQVQVGQSAVTRHTSHTLLSLQNFDQRFSNIWTALVNLSYPILSKKAHCGRIIWNGTVVIDLVIIDALSFTQIWHCTPVLLQSLTWRRTFS